MEQTESGLKGGTSFVTASGEMLDRRSRGAAKDQLLQPNLHSSRQIDMPLIDNSVSSFRARGKAWAHPGFTLLELMIVLSIMMILMAVALPLYQHHVILAREAVLHQNLDTLRRVLEQYRLDKGQSPQALDDLVTAGYLSKLPADPMTNKADWVTESEDPTEAVDPQQTGIGKVHSASNGTALNGEAYNTW